MDDLIAQRIREHEESIRRLKQDWQDDPTLNESYIFNQILWSQRTFGPGNRTAGVLDHIRKELTEIEQEHDVSEWADIIILALDGAWREGNTPKEILTALWDKQEVNRSRQWPDWRTAEEGKAIEHIRE